MIRWFAGRLMAAVGTAIAAIAVLTALVHLLPGDPLTAVLVEGVADPAARAAMAERWQIDRPVFEATISTVSRYLTGDFGVAMASGRPVAGLLGERLGPTMLLGGLTLLIHFTIGIAIGLWSALRPHSFSGRAVTAFTLIGYSLPSFVIGMLLVWLFSIHWQLLPPAGVADPFLPANAGIVAALADRLRHLALPLATMVIATVAVPIRHQRTAALATATAPWVLAARARGVAGLPLILRHVWRPALTPVVTLMGLWLPALVAGAVFVEAIFAWPGIGSLLAEATARRDIPVVLGAGALTIVFVQLGSLLADGCNRLLDPRQRS